MLITICNFFTIFISSNVLLRYFALYHYILFRATFYFTLRSLSYQHTLSFTLYFLRLNYILNERFLTSSLMSVNFLLLRLIRRGHIPYHRMSQVLPNHMKFSKEDISTFSYRPLNVKKIHEGTNFLLNYLDLPNIPAPDFFLLIAKLILDFQLPGMCYLFVFYYLISYSLFHLLTS